MTAISVRDESGVAVVRIDRPPANAMDPALLREGERVAAELRDAGPGAVVITGEGRFFSGGLDLGIVPSLPAAELPGVVEGVNRLLTAWYGFPRPVVAAVNGHAVAGGLLLALCGDRRLAVPDAKLGLTEVAVGVPYPVAAIAIVRAEVPQPLVRRLVLGGELVEPRTALDGGVVDELVDVDALLERSLTTARQLAEHPRETYERVKRQLRGPVLDAIAAVEHDPLADDWLGDETPAAAAATLRRGLKGV